jgi:hypothetical protein
MLSYLNSDRVPLVICLVFAFVNLSFLVKVWQKDSEKSFTPLLFYLFWCLTLVPVYFSPSHHQHVIFLIGTAVFMFLHIMSTIAIRKDVDNKWNNIGLSSCILSVGVVIFSAMGSR